MLLPAMVKEMPVKGRVAGIRTACMVSASLWLHLHVLFASRVALKVQCCMVWWWCFGC